ncbi:MAG: carboxypeptidase M32 [Candidatus Thorarchaeota archaeon]
MTTAKTRVPREVKDVPSAYDELMSRAKEISLLGSIGSLLQWDMQTYLPPRGVALRGEQFALVGMLTHRLQTSKEYGDLIKRAESEIRNGSDDVKKRNLYLLRKSHDEAACLPEDLVAEINRQVAIAQDVWRKARNQNDWNTFAPELSKLFSLVYRRSEMLQDVKGVKRPYDSSIDDFEPLMSSTEISRVFSELRSGLIPLIRKYSQIAADIDMSKIRRHLTKDRQRAIAEDVVNLMGYDTRSENAGGRIDETVHPFTTGYYDDVRITLRYTDDDPMGTLLTAMHEAGHAIYELSLAPEWKYQPVGTAAGMGIHESISRFYENMIGRSPEFWEHYLPRANELSGGVFSNITPEDVTRCINRVTPSKIRVSADEVTYSIHVIIRFEIERDLFEGKIQIDELPQVWNEKYEDYLGVEVRDDKDGVLQDVHWSSGYFGYFPTYALGNVYAGMWLKKMRSEIPDCFERISEGDILYVTRWIGREVLVKSNMWCPADLVKRVTGEDVSAEPFLSYVRDKYSRIYG